MRVIAGRFKGRRLAGPAGPGLRPTSDSLRETLFNILGESIEGARVLDAFAGTGALGLEAISRGAARVMFVEHNRRTIQLLKENIRRCGAEDTCAIVNRDFFSAFTPPGNWPDSDTSTPRQPGTSGSTMFDLVVLDPPYDEKDLEAVIRAAASVLAPAGRVVLEHSRRRAAPESAAHLARTRLVTAGDSALSFYQ